MGFAVKVNGETVEEVDVDPALVDHVLIGSYKIPVAFGDVELDLQIVYKSATDAEVVAARQAAETDEANAEAEIIVEPPESVVEAREAFASSQADPDAVPVPEEEENKQEKDEKAEKTEKKEEKKEETTEKK